MLTQHNSRMNDIVVMPSVAPVYYWRAGLSLLYPYSSI